MHALETWETLRLIRRTVGMGGFAGVQSDAMRDLIGVLTAEGGSASCPAELPLSGELKSEEWSEVAALIDGNIGAALAHRDRKLHTLARLDELRARIPLLDERIQHLEQRLSRPRAAKKKA